MNRFFACALILLSVPFNSLANPGDSSAIQTPDRELIELEIEGIYEYPDGQSFLVQLTKKGGKENWVLPMVIGGCNAVALARVTYDVDTPRPMTHDLMKDIVDNTSLKMRQVVITKLKEGTFYAVLVLRDGKKVVQIDSRPSDAINIAQRMKVPIFATTVVLDEAKEKKE